VVVAEILRDEIQKPWILRLSGGDNSKFCHQVGQDKKFVELLLVITIGYIEQNQAESKLVLPDQTVDLRHVRGAMNVPISEPVPAQPIRDVGRL
jgi:hypothetical protein